MYYTEAEVEPVYTSAEALVAKANPAVVVEPVAEFLGNRENYHFTRNYPTHLETWNVVETRSGAHRSEYVFEDRNGVYWTLFHNFHHTQREADEEYTRVAKFCSEQCEPLWQVIL